MSQLAVKKQEAVKPDAMARARMFWESRTPRQRVYLGVGLGVALALTFWLSQMITSPDYKTVVSGLESVDAQALGAQLQQKKIPFKLGPDGTSVSVPADQADAARLEAASHEGPRSGRIGFEIFDKVAWGETEFDEKVNYQRALEGELERTIRTMDNVKSVRVHLVMAKDSVFLDRERNAKASVTLTLRRGGLSQGESDAIQRLVAGAVDELKPTDVVIIDADTSRSLNGNSDPMNGGAANMEQQLTRRLMDTLSPVVGADRLRTNVNVEYDNSTSEENQEKYDPAVSVPLNMERSEENASGAGSSGIMASGGVPGTSSNLPQAKAAETTKTMTSPTQSSKSESATYGVNKVTRHIVQPAGRIHRLTAAVVVDDVMERRQEKGKWVEAHRKRSPEELQRISELAQAAIGFDSARGDVVSVQNLSFDRSNVEELPALGLLDRTGKAVSQYSYVLRYAALLALFSLTYFFVLRPIQTKALAEGRARQPALTSTESEDSLGLPEPAESLSERVQVLKKQLAESVRSNPEGSASTIRAWLQEDKA